MDHPVELDSGVGPAAIRPASASDEKRSRTSRREPRDLASRWALEAVGEVAGNIAREIGSPLTAIEMAVDRLRRQRNGLRPDPSRQPGADPQDEPSSQAQAARNREEAELEIILQQSLRLAGLARTLLAVANPAPPRPRAVALNDLVDQVVGSMKAEMEAARIEVRTSFWEALPTVQADPHQIRGALMALLTNARLALEGWDGRRTVTVSTGRDPRGQARIRVHDSGPGVAEGHEERVFLPFFSGWGREGVGLSLSRLALLNQGGELVLENQVGGTGALFTLLFEPEIASVQTVET